MLVRVSSLSPSLAESYALQLHFLQQMHDALPADVRTRYFGAAKSSDTAAPSPPPA
jgi:hypothetical protein